MRNPGNASRKTDPRDHGATYPSLEPFGPCPRAACW